MPDRSDADAVSANYTPGDLAEKILASLRAAGKDADTLTADDLAPVDQFHSDGKDATIALMRRAGLRPEMRVLDIGGGLGGPARTLAVEVGCHVTVIDLSAEYCRVGAMLTERMGLGGHVVFRHGDATELPFVDGSFDAVWTQHSTMNIAAKGRLYAEIYRVLRPGGRYALHDAMAGPVQPVYFPITWAHDASISFLSTPDEVRALLTETGFTEREWVEMPFSPPPPPAADGPPSLGLHLVVSDFATRGMNFVRSRAEHRLRVFQGVFARP